jgi:hypothetical protein
VQKVGILLKLSEKRAILTFSQLEYLRLDKGEFILLVQQTADAGKQYAHKEQGRGNVN